MPTLLRAILSDLQQNKYRHNFPGSLDPFCSRSRNSIIKTVFNISLVKGNDAIIIDILLFGWKCLCNICKTTIINITLEYILLTKRFNKPLIWIISNKMCVIQIPNVFWFFPSVFLVFFLFFCCFLTLNLALLNLYHQCHVECYENPFHEFFSKQQLFSLDLSFSRVKVFLE